MKQHTLAYNIIKYIYVCICGFECVRSEPAQNITFVFILETHGVPLKFKTTGLFSSVIVRFWVFFFFWKLLLLTYFCVCVFYGFEWDDFDKKWRVLCETQNNNPMNLKNLFMRHLRKWNKWNQFHRLYFSSIWMHSYVVEKRCCCS